MPSFPGGKKKKGVANQSKEAEETMLQQEKGGIRLLLMEAEKGVTHISGEEKNNCEMKS